MKHLAPSAILVFALLAIVLQPSANAGGTEFNCSDGIGRNGEGEVTYRQHDCPISVLGPNGLVCIGSHEKWTQDPDGTTETMRSCDYGIS